MKDFKIIVSVCFAALIIYTIAQYNKPKPVSWQSTLYYKDKIPFGTYVLHQQLNHIFPTSKVVQTNLPPNKAFTDSSIAGNYLIVASAIDVNKYDYQQLIKFLKAGNNVFITTFVWKGFLADTLKLKAQSEYKISNVGLNFTSPHLKLNNPYSFQHDISNQYFSRFDTSRAVVLSKNTLGHSNYLRFNFGKGSLYLCANPHVFSNYSLLTAQGADYAAKALSYLPASHYVYWDQYQNKDIQQDMSPLRVIFSNDSLIWAYYIGLFTTVLFILYQMKRRQRIIPVIEPLQNSTLEFVNVVGQVYYEQRDNSNIALKKIIYLLEHLRTLYNLKTTVLNKDFVDALAQKTGIEQSLASNLIGLINYLHSQTRVSDSEIIKLNQLIEEFYAQSR